MKYLFPCLVTAMAALAAHAVDDIPFWGQANPPTNRTTSASACYVLPAGTDFRVKTVACSTAIPFSTGRPGAIIVFH